MLQKVVIKVLNGGTLRFFRTSKWSIGHINRPTVNLPPPVRERLIWMLVMHVGDSLYQAWLLKRLSPIFYHSSRRWIFKIESRFQTDRSLQSWCIQTQQIRSMAPAMIPTYETYLVWNSKYRSTNWFINRARRSWITLITIW